MQNRSLRWLIAGNMFPAMTTGMRKVARGWLVYDVTGSVLTLGWVSAVRALAQPFRAVDSGPAGATCLAGAVDKGVVRCQRVV